MEGQSSSSRNKGKRQSKSKSKFVGVRQRGSGKWVAEIKNTSEKIRMWLGTFDTAEEAAQAYDEAACLLRGSNTRTNLLHTTPCNPALSFKIRNLVCQKRSQLKLMNNKLLINHEINSNSNSNINSKATTSTSSSINHHPSLQELMAPPLPDAPDYWGDTHTINLSDDAAFWDFQTLCQMFSPT